MNKAEAVKIVRNIYQTDKEKEALETLIPELKESEDERIRNLIYCLIRDRSDNQKLLEHNGVSVDKALAYLEKQKENPETVDSIPPFCASNVKWADTIITRAIVALSDDVDYNRDEPCKYKREIDELKKLRDVLCGKKEQEPFSQEVFDAAKHEALWGEQKPAEWSEEDEQIKCGIECLIMFALQDGSAVAPGCNTTKEQTLNWIKSIRPSWRPSKKQMEALGNCVLGRTPDADARITLEILWDNLQKLL